MKAEQTRGKITVTTDGQGDAIGYLPLDMDQCWPTKDVLDKLIEAAEILLHKHDYDGHGWELIAHAVDRGKEISARIKNNR
jgi:hypothetical protein